MVGLENLMLVNQTDLQNLKTMLERQNSEIEQLGKFKDECSAPLFTFVTQVRRKMTALEK